MPDLHYNSTEARSKMLRPTRTAVVSNPPPLRGVHYLPYELLVQVFLYGLASCSDGPSRYRYLLTITRVYSYWRAVAISCAPLWTIVECGSVHPVLGRYRLEYTSQRAMAFLERSNPLPISLKVDLANGPVRDEDLKRVWNSVSPHLSRCQSIILAFRDASMMRECLPLRGSFDHLQTVEISCGSSPKSTASMDGDSPRVPLFADGNAPPLRHIRLAGSSALSLTDISTSAVDSLHIEADPNAPDAVWDNITGVLSQSTTVSDLKLITTTRTTLPIPKTPLVLPGLRSLKIIDELGTTFSRIMSAPNLEHLEILQSHRDPVGDITRLPFKLRSLTLTYLNHNPEESALRLLKRQPSITSLTINECPYIFMLINALAQVLPGDDAPYMLPKLQTLTLRQTRGKVDEDVWEIMFGLLVLRPRLEVVYTGGYEGASPEWRHRFSCFQGLFGSRIRKVGEFTESRWPTNYYHPDTVPLFINDVNTVPYLLQRY